MRFGHNIRHNISMSKKLPIEDRLAPLFSLSESKLAGVNSLIFKHSKFKEAAVLLRDSYGLYADLELATIVGYLKKYKSEYKEVWSTYLTEEQVHIDNLPESIKKDIPASIVDVVKLSKWEPYSRVKAVVSEAVLKFDAMQELERLATLQYGRVLKGMEFEEKLIEKEKLPKSPLDPYLKKEIDTLSHMLKDIVTLQMDLGIRHKVEAVQNHFHMSLDQNQQALLKNFNNMKIVSDITTQALEMLNGVDISEAGGSNDPILSGSGDQ